MMGECWVSFVLLPMDLVIVFFFQMNCLYVWRYRLRLLSLSPSGDGGNFAAVCGKIAIYIFSSYRRSITLIISFSYVGSLSLVSSELSTKITVTYQRKRGTSSAQGADGATPAEPPSVSSSGVAGSQATKDQPDADADDDVRKPDSISLSSL